MSFFFVQNKDCNFMPKSYINVLVNICWQKYFNKETTHAQAMNQQANVRANSRSLLLCNNHASCTSSKL